MFERSGLHVFSIARVPVSVSFGFALIAVFIMMRQGITMGAPFMAALALSVLIHEFGHAAVCKRYNLEPSILLHGFGGLCFHQEASTDGRDALIVVMGPLVEIIVGVIALAGLMLAPESIWGLNSAMIVANRFLSAFAWISIIWGVANLVLPIWPLDGGKLFHLLLRRFTSADKAALWTLRVSMAVTIPLTIAALYFGQFFVGIVAFFLIMENYNGLKSGAPLVGRGGAKAVVKPLDPFSRELLDEAEDALREERWRDAARLCHQVRAHGKSLSGKKLDRVWEILAIATTELGEYEEATHYIKRAPKSDAVRRAQRICQEHLDAPAP